MDEIVNIGSFSRSNEFLFRGVRSAEKDIFPDRSVKEERGLLHDPHIGPQEFLGKIGDRNVIYADGAGLRFIETGDQSGKGRFTRTGFSDKCNRFARRNFQRYVVQHIGFFFRHIVILETDLIENDPAGNGSGQGGDGVRFILDLRLFHHDFMEAFKGSHALLIAFHEPHQLHDRHSDLVGVHEEGDQFRRVGFVQIDHADPEGDENDRVPVHEKAHAGMEKRHGGEHALLRFAVVVVHIIEAVDLKVFVGVGLDFTDALDGVFHLTVDVCHFFPDIPEALFHLRQKFRTPEDHERNGQQRQQSQEGIDAEHDGQTADQHEDRGNNIFRAVMRHLRDHRQVVGDLGHDMPCLGFVKVTEGKFLQVRKKVRPHVRLHPDPQRMTETGLDVVGDDVEHGQTEDAQQAADEHADIFLGQVGLERIVNDHRQCRGEKRREHHKDHVQHQQFFVLWIVVDKGLENGDLFFECELFRRFVTEKTGRHERYSCKVRICSRRCRPAHSKTGSRIRSSSPSIRDGRSNAETPNRWSVIRFCGKL